MRRIPVVALTSAMAAQANALTQAGCIGFMPKPFDPAEFLHLHESAARNRPAHH
jgi:CheY-like chemotaxis protein